MSVVLVPASVSVRLCLTYVLVKSVVFSALLRLRTSMKRVAQVMSKADRRKHDKFSNQFNYALN